MSLFSDRLFPTDIYPAHFPPGPRPGNAHDIWIHGCRITIQYRAGVPRPHREPDFPSTSTGQRVGLVFFLHISKPVSVILPSKQEKIYVHSFVCFET